MPDDETISSLPPDVQALVEEAMAKLHPDTPAEPLEPEPTPPAEPPAPPEPETPPEPEAVVETAPFLAFEHVYERVGCGNHARRVTRDREPAAPPEGHRFVQTYTLRFDTAAQRDAALV